MHANVKFYLFFSVETLLEIMRWGSARTVECCAYAPFFLLLLLFFTES